MADMVRRFREWDPEAELHPEATAEGEATLARGLGNAQAAAPVARENADNSKVGAIGWVM